MTPERPKLVGHEQEEHSSSPKQRAASDSQAVLAWHPTTERQIQERKLSYAVLMLVTAAALCAAYVIYRPFLKALFLALVLTIAFWPLHEWIGRRVQGATARALITTAAVVLLIMAPLMLISLQIFSEAAGLYALLSQHVGGGWSGHFAWLTQAVEQTSEHTGIPAAQLKAPITSRVQQLGSWLVGMGGWAVQNFAQLIGAALLTLLIMFFLLRDKEKYTRGVVQALPLPPGRVQELTATLRTTIVSNVYGMVAVGLIQGALTAVGWWMTGLRAGSAMGSYRGNPLFRAAPWSFLGVDTGSACSRDAGPLDSSGGAFRLGYRCGLRC